MYNRQVADSFTSYVIYSVPATVKRIVLQCNNKVIGTIGIQVTKRDNGWTSREKQRFVEIIPSIYVD
jgi:hypothetical protein